MDREQLCWGCKNATGGCSWSRELKPINGWVAKAMVTKDKANSYYITACPLFKQEDKQQITVCGISKMIGIHKRTVFRYMNSRIALVKELLKAKGYELIIYTAAEAEGRNLYYIREIKNKK